ncbi:MAG TPA: hypothetical protein VMA96_09740 [Solirubrobacteraceae bacterium]|nr:hypothetical protein [Solirubrobacteraceae bacterium]
MAVAGVPVRAPGEPAPTWWAHHCGVAWMAAWLTLRGREFKGGRELLEFDTWSGEISWQDHRGFHDSKHRPDLVGFRVDGRPIAVEVELAPKSIERLRGILFRHAVWRHAGKSNGVYYICGDEDGLKRIRKAANTGRTFRYDDVGLTFVLLDTIIDQTIAAADQARRARVAGGPWAAANTPADTA